MSDTTTGSAYNPQFFMNPPWWIGRVESKETWVDNIEGETFTSTADIKGWGYRYKVRVFNWHTGDLNKLSPNDMAFCQVIMPVTSGSGHGGSAQTPSIESGSVVFGFFMDGMAGQEGYIVGVLGNSNNNVPKERGVSAPNQTAPRQASTPPPTKPGTKNVTGTALNQPLPANVDSLSAETLKRYLDPSKTPSSAVFKAATEARQKARSQGLSAAEVERQVLIATAKASRGSNSDIVQGNCNQGYQQFNDTYSDSSKSPALVPDNLRVGNVPLSTTDAVHVNTKAWLDQDEDRKRKQALLSACKKKNSETKGIQRTIKNLINDVEKIKKEVGAVTSKAQEIAGQVQTIVSNASDEIARYLKIIMGSVRGYVLDEVSKQTKKILPFLYPTEIPKFNQQIEKSQELISCLFNKLVNQLKGIIANLLSELLDKVINAALCVIEDLLANIFSQILGPILDTINSALEPIFALVGGSTGKVSGTKKQNNFSGDMFSAFEFVSQIFGFFKCDDDFSCPEYDEINLGSNVATPGGDVSSLFASNVFPTGKGQGNTTSSISANITNKLSKKDKKSLSLSKTLRESIA